MGAEKIVKINSEHEVEYLKERINLLESIIDYSLAETLQELKSRVKDLENEAITLRATDSEKDKLIAEQKNMITYLQTDVDKLADVKASKIVKDIKADYERQLVNAKSNGSRPVRAENKTLKESLITQQEMYTSLLSEFNQSHENEKAILSICNEILSNIKQLISNGATPDELVEKIDSGIKSLEKKVTKTKAELIAEDKKIIQMIDDGMSDSDIADIIYSHLDDPKVRRVQLSKRKATQRFKELVGN